MHLVGRWEQREAILAALGRAGSGAGEVVVLVGGPGSGRTALLTWAAAAAAERGLEVDVLDDADGSDETVARLRALDADPAQHRLVLAASAIPLRLRTELPLPPLTVDEIAALAGGLPPDVARAVRAASRGLPSRPPTLSCPPHGVPASVGCGSSPGLSSAALWCTASTCATGRCPCRRPTTQPVRVALGAFLAHQDLPPVGARGTSTVLVPAVVTNEGPTPVTITALQVMLCATWRP